MDTRPIGMFDSGIGGLTVLKEYVNLLPNENYIYYADTIHLPYGDKTKEQIISYAEKIVNFFISKNVKAIVIACGTASSLAYGLLKEKYNIPIFDIITPTASALKFKNVGIIATQGSVNSHVWEKKIHEYNSETNICSVACPKLVPLAEKGLTKSLFSKHAIQEYLNEFKNTSIEALILGCTHYPLFSNLIRKELGEKIELINIGTFSAQFFQSYLKEYSMGNYNNNLGKIEYYSSGNIEEFLKKKDVIQNLLDKI